MEHKDTLQNQPRHFRVEVPKSMSPEAKAEVNDANLFLTGLSAINNWKTEFMDKKINEIQASGETTIQDINFIDKKARQATYLFGLMRMIPRVRSIEEDHNQNVAVSLSEAFLTCFGEHYRLPKDFELTIENTRKHIVRGIERMSHVLGKNQDEPAHLLNGVPGNFWRVAEVISHDALNPVSNIYSGALMITQDYNRGIKEIDQDTLRVIINSASNLESIFKECFNLLSNEFPKEKISASQIRNEVDSALSSKLKRNLGVQFEMKTTFSDAEQLGYVLWSRTWLRTLLDNIYQNEAKAYRDKKEMSSKKVSSSLVTQDGWLILTIEDNAGGFQDERILKEGFSYGYGSWESQEKNLSERVESTKVGMAGQSEMIRKYSGSIVPENYKTEDGKTGARIRIILPVHE